MTGASGNPQLSTVLRLIGIMGKDSFVEWSGRQQVPISEAIGDLKTACDVLGEERFRLMALAEYSRGNVVTENLPTLEEHRSDDEVAPTQAAPTDLTPQMADEVGYYIVIFPLPTLKYTPHISESCRCPFTGGSHYCCYARPESMHQLWHCPDERVASIP